MTSNSDHAEQPSTDTTADDSQSEPQEGDDEVGEPPGTTITRRHALVGAGLGLGLLQRFTNQPPEPRARPWNQDVDANEHELRTLGGLNMATMDEDALLTDFEGSNLELDGTRLRLSDELDVETATLAALRGDLTGGESVTDLTGEDLFVDNGRLNVASAWTRTDALLTPSDSDVDGIEVEDVQSPDDETLAVESDAELVLSLSGDAGAIRIETPGGHEIVLDDAEESESISVEDSAGNSVEMDSNADTVSISANQKIELDAPTIELSASADLEIESGATASIGSAGIVEIDGALVKVGPGGRPAASVGDTVSEGVIRSGSPSVLL